jgi:hypothetical protein
VTSMESTVTPMVSILGPVSSGSPWGGPGLFEIIAVLACALIVTDRVREYRRRVGLRDMAARRGFTYLGSSLPSTLTLRGTGLAGIASVWNVIDADCGGPRVICFDCCVGTGKGSWRRTVIAAKGAPDVFDTTLTGDLIVDQSGEWSIMYEPKRISLIPGWPMAVSEIEAHLGAIVHPVR